MEARCARRADYNGVPGYEPYNISQTVGYPGKYYEGSSVDNRSYTRLFVLETGKSCIPVAFVSANRQVLDGMDHNARAVVGSVRLAPLRASPIKNTVSIADLVGQWTNGIVNSIDYYNSSGQYQSHSLSALRSEYIISADGRYTYKSFGLINNRRVSDDDTGVVEFGGEFLTFKGQRHVTRNRFMSLQEALDGSMVLTLWPPVEMSQISPMRDSLYWTRVAKKR